MRFHAFHYKYGEQCFDVPDALVDELRHELYLWGWRKSPKEAREVVLNPEVDLRQSDAELGTVSKSALIKAAKDQLGIDLDKRKSPRNLIADIREAQRGDSE